MAIPQKNHNKKEIPAGITTKRVLTNFIKVIGKKNNRLSRKNDKANYKLRRFSIIKS
jgi:hypothetical protein